MTTADLNDLSLMQEVIEVDGAANPEEFFNPPLADDGDHTVILRLGNTGIRVMRQQQKGDTGQTRTGPGFLDVHLQLKEVKASGGEGATVAFDHINTVVMESSVGRTTRAHMVFAVAGFPLTEKSLGGLKDEMERAVAQNPQAVVTTRWEAQVNRGTKDKVDWQTVLVGQKNFPRLLDAQGNETGRFNPEVTDPKTGQVVRAQVRVTKYGPVGA